jgi:hypothetical protein
MKRRERVTKIAKYSYCCKKPEAATQKPIPVEWPFKKPAVNMPIEI